MNVWVACLAVLTLQSLSWSDLGLHWEGGYQIRDRHIIKESERGWQQRPGKTLEVGGRYKRRIREVYKEGHRRRDIVPTLDATRKHFRAYSKPPYFSSLVLDQRGEFFYTQMPVHVCVCHGVHVVTTQIQNPCGKNVTRSQSGCSGHGRTNFWDFPRFFEPPHARAGWKYACLSPAT